MKLFNQTLLASSVAVFTLGLGACSKPADKTAEAKPETTAKTTATDTNTATAGDTTSQPGKGIKVQALQSPIAEETFQTIVLNEGLKQLGYEVQPIKQVDYTAAYVSIANGDATYMPVSWFPLQNEMYKNAGGDTKMVREGHYIEGAAQGYLIDKKTAEEHKIDSVDDLQKPEIAKLFDTDGDGKADLTGCQAGWGCEKVIEHHLDAYKLRDTVTHKQGQYSAIIADTIARYQAGKPVLYYTWTPYWVSGKLSPNKDVVWLTVPFTANPNSDDTTAPDGKNYGFAVNSERVVINKAFAEANPAAKAFLTTAKLPINDVSAQNMLIADGEDKPEQIEAHAQNWIKANQDKFNSWLAAGRAAAK